MAGKLFAIFSAVAILNAPAAFSQTEWKKYEGNPVLVPAGDLEIAGVIGPRVLKVNNQYMMWYTSLGGHRQISLATSTDGIRWTKFPANPVLPYGKPGDFDSEHVTYGMVMLLSNKYWMWYSGHNGSAWQIGLATSGDGINWTKASENPILKIGNTGAWDAAGVIAPFVIFDGRIFKMWYNGNGSPFIQAGGYAESSDGIHWQKYVGNPIFTPVPSAWESNTIGMNTIMLLDGKYHLWYGAGGSVRNGLGYATSADGLKWERYVNNPILLPGTNGEWDSGFLGGFNVLRENNIFKMWYSGEAGGGWRIGYAVSTSVLPTERSIFIPRVYGRSGDTIKVTIYADPIADVSGGDFKISFDPAVLNAIKVQTTDFTKNFLAAANLDTPGVARVSLAGAQSAAGKLGGLLTINMIVSRSVPSQDTSFTRPLKLDAVALYDQSGQPLPVKRRNGMFVLGLSRGDVNDDGLVNAADAVLVLRLIVGLFQPTPSQLADADVDDNGKVESFDASCILLRAVGLPCPSGGASLVAASVMVASFAANAGSEVTTNITVGGIAQLLSGDVKLRFDSKALEITEIRPSANLSGAAFVTKVDNTDEINFSFAASEAIAPPAIAEVRLRAKSAITEKNLRSITATFFDAQGRRWNSLVTKVEENSIALPEEFRLEQNYPNPFYRDAAAPAFNATSRATTQIRYAAPQAGHVKLMIYDLAGRLVRILENAEQVPGEYARVWDGLDDRGQIAASGVYIYRLQVGQNVFTKKLLLLE